jgi:hypothetical protein
MAADHLGNPVGTPQFVVPAVGLGPLQEQTLPGPGPAGR